MKNSQFVAQELFIPFETTLAMQKYSQFYFCEWRTDEQKGDWG